MVYKIRMRFVTLVYFALCMFSICPCLKAETWAEEKMGNIVKNVGIDVDDILAHKINLIENNWDIISGFTLPGKKYQKIATLLCCIFRVVNIVSAENVFSVTERILIRKIENGGSYEQEFSRLLDIIKEKAKRIENGLRAFQKAQDSVAYYNENGEWPYDDDGGYTVEDFLNDEDEEGTKPVIPMSESGSSSIQNSNETSPQKDAVQEKTSVLRSIPMEVE